MYEGPFELGVLHSPALHSFALEYRPYQNIQASAGISSLHGTTLNFGEQPYSRVRQGQYMPLF